MPQFPKLQIDKGGLKLCIGCPDYLTSIRANLTEIQIIGYFLPFFFFLSSEGFNSFDVLFNPERTEREGDVVDSGLPTASSL